MKTTLIAPCGMNCAICLAFLRKKNRCDGCWSPERKCSKNCTILPVRWSGAGTITTALSSRVKDSASSTSGTKKK